MGVDYSKLTPAAQGVVRAALAREAAEKAERHPAPEPIPAEVKLTVWGHARPSKRITEAMIHTETAQGYLRWQRQVAEACIEIRPRPLPWAFFDVSVVFYFTPPTNEDAPGFGDYVNLRKAVEDGLAEGGIFPAYNGRANDARLRWDSGPSGVKYCRLKKRERVEITIREWKMPDPVD